jgi:muconolactone delta-isomerase
MTRSRTDANKGELVDRWRSAGGYWEDCPREAGHDGNAAFRGRWFPVEIKDGRKPRSKQKLTLNEQRARAELEARGIAYHIWRSFEDVDAEIAG